MDKLKDGETLINHDLYSEKAKIPLSFRLLNLLTRAKILRNKTKKISRFPVFRACSYLLIKHSICKEY